MHAQKFLSVKNRLKASYLAGPALSEGSIHNSCAGFFNSIRKISGVKIVEP